MITKYLTKDNIILALLAFIILRGFFSSPEIVNENDVIYREKIKAMEQEKLLLLNKNDSLNGYYEVIEKNISADSLDIWTADRNKRDSIRQHLNPR